MVGKEDHLKTQKPIQRLSSFCTKLLRISIYFSLSWILFFIDFFQALGNVNFLRGVNTVSIYLYLSFRVVASSRDLYPPGSGKVKHRL